MNSDTIHIAAARGDLVAVRNFVEVEGVDVDCRNEYGRTPLAVAIFICIRKESDAPTLPSVIRYLVSKKAKVETNVVLSSSITPLMLASSIGQLEIVKILLEEGGANVNYGQPHSGTTALMLACQPEGFCVIPDLLRHGANVNPPLSNGGTPPLSLVCRFRNSAMAIQQLLEYGADVDATQLLTAMHHSAGLSDEATDRPMIADRPIIKRQTRESRTPLWEAAYRGNVPAVRVLLQHDAKVDLLCGDGTSILHVNIKAECMGIILNHCRSSMAEADLNKFLLQASNKGDIALHRVQTIKQAKLLIEQPRRQGKHLLPVCHMQLASKNDDGLTPTAAVLMLVAAESTSRGRLLLEYLQSFESLPLAIPGASTSVSSSSTTSAKRRKLSDRIAVKLNPQLNDFQRSVAEEAVQVVMGAATELPDAMVYAILGHLSPLDMMKRTTAVGTTV